MLTAGCLLGPGDSEDTLWSWEELALSGSTHCPARAISGIFCIVLRPGAVAGLRPVAWKGLPQSAPELDLVLSNLGNLCSSKFLYDCLLFSVPRDPV